MPAGIADTGRVDHSPSARLYMWVRSQGRLQNHGEMVRNQNPGPSAGSASEAALGAQLTPLRPGEMTRVHSSAIHAKPPECPPTGTMDTGLGAG